MKPSCSYCFPVFPMVFLWCSYVFLWFSYSFPMVFLWFSHVFLWFPMVFLWFSYVFLWFFYGFPMFSYGFPVVFLCFPMVSTLQGLDLGVGGGLGALRPLHAAADRLATPRPLRRCWVGALGGPGGPGTDRIAVGFKMCSDHWMYTLNIYIYIYILYAQIYKYIYIYII